MASIKCIKSVTIREIKFIIFGYVNTAAEHILILHNGLPGVFPA